MNLARVVTVAVGAALLLAATAMTGFWLGRHPAADAPAATPSEQAVEKRPVLYWYDPMYPDKRFDKPGKSPFMDMMLVPKYAQPEGHGTGNAAGNEAGDAAHDAEVAARVHVDPRLAQNLGIRLARAERGTLTRAVETVGSVQADDTRRVSVQSRATGWVESLQVRAVDERVRRGQLLARIYSPDLLAAQEEYLLLASRTQSDADRDLLAAALQRLSLLGLSGLQIEALQRSGRARRAIAVHAPADGIVSELGAREGAQVSPGMTLFSLLDLSSVWVVAEVPERQIAGVTVGARVQATLSAFPGETFTGTVGYIYPGVNSETRAVRVRSSLRNVGWKLKPGMVARVRLEGASPPEHVLVPSDALIRTGQRVVVILAQAAGGFRPVEVDVGAESDGKAEILAGLKAGENVVVSGQFLIDSEANLRSAMGRLGAETSAAPAVSAPAPATDVHYAQGVVEAVDREKSEITITHGPFATLHMPGMTMTFAASSPAVLATAAPGRRVRFAIRRDEQGRYGIVEMRPDDTPQAASAQGVQP